MSEVTFIGTEMADATYDAATNEGPMGPAALEQEEQFCAALHAWDRHVDSCRACFSLGQGLCDDALEIQARAVSARDAVESLAFQELTTAPTPSRHPLLRRMWIGWAAFIAPLTG
jgi:hypothetical protein